MRNTVAKRLNLIAALTGVSRKAIKRRWNGMPRRGPGLMVRSVKTLDGMIAMLKAAYKAKAAEQSAPPAE